jgi:hypothetical protein
VRASCPKLGGHVAEYFSTKDVIRVSTDAVFTSGLNGILALIRHAS